MLRMYFLQQRTGNAGGRRGGTTLRTRQEMVLETVIDEAEIFHVEIEIQGKAVPETQMSGQQKIQLH